MWCESHKLWFVCVVNDDMILRFSDYKQVIVKIVVKFLSLAVSVWGPIDNMALVSTTRWINRLSLRVLTAGDGDDRHINYSLVTDSVTSKHKSLIKINVELFVKVATTTYNYQKWITNKQVTALGN